MIDSAKTQGGEHQAWELGYAQGYSDREKTDHDRADVEKSPNPYPVEAQGGGWIAGSPSERGSYWIVMWLHHPDRWEVRLVDVSPALLNPGGRLLLKMIGGAAFEYEPNRYAISHYMLVVEPVSPVNLDRPAPPEATKQPEGGTRG